MHEVISLACNQLSLLRHLELVVVAVRYLPSLQPTEENFTARNWSMLLPGGIYLAFDQLSQEMPNQIGHSSDLLLGIG